MLARQLCLWQARSVGVRRPVCLALATPPSQLPKRCVSTTKSPPRPRPTGSRTTIGTATMVDVDGVPTMINSRASNEGLGKNQVRNLDREFRDYLRNPYKLANAVKSRLAKDRYEEALVLARNASKASKYGQAVVSWNYLIDYTMKQQKLHAAIKLFNEMKKRQQLPNASTFTTLFRGCATSQHAKLAVSEAMKIYMTMLTSSRLRPNIIHTNVVLQVCARALDIEAMMSIAETIDDRERKADAITYATLLHGLRATVDAEEKKVVHFDADGQAEELHRDNISRVIRQGKQIWEEVLRKWRAGALVLDERVVCAMGRILLLGDKADKMMVLDLLEQTMSITNLSRKDGEAEKATTESASGHPDGKDAGGAAASKRDLSAPQKKPALCPVPTNKSLSLVLMALQDTRRIHLTLGYWRIFTEKYKVDPDSNVWYTLLYSLRRSHSSSQAVSVLRSMPAHFITEKAIFIAFKTCVLDNVNPQVMQNADAILDRMLEVLPRPNLECLRLYVDIATKSHHKFRLEKKQGADHAPLDIAYGEQVAAAIENLWKKGAIPSCRDRLIVLLERASGKGNYLPKRRPKPDGSRGRVPDPDAEARNEAAEFLALMRKVVSALDSIISDGLLPKEKLEALRVRRNTGNWYITNYFDVLKYSGAMEDFDEAGDGGKEGQSAGGHERAGQRPPGRRKPRNAQIKGPTDNSKLFGGLLSLTMDFKQQMPA